MDAEELTINAQEASMTENNPVVAESGVAFPAETSAEVSVEARFLESGTQLQQVFIGLEPVLLVQPEFDAEANTVTFVTTAVDLDPEALVAVLEVLLDGAKTMAEQQAEMRAEQRADIYADPQRQDD